MFTGIFQLLPTTLTAANKVQISIAFYVLQEKNLLSKSSIESFLEEIKPVL